MSEPVARAANPDSLNRIARPQAYPGLARAG